MVTEVSCPICRKRVHFEGNPHRPFCSKQCQMRDLGAWASEEYRVEGKEDESGREEGAVAPPPPKDETQ